MRSHFWDRQAHTLQYWALATILMTIFELQCLKHLLQTPPVPWTGATYTTVVISQENQHFCLLKTGTSSRCMTETQARVLSKELLYVNTLFVSICAHNYLLITEGERKSGQYCFCNAGEFFWAKSAARLMDQDSLFSTARLDLTNKKLAHTSLCRIWPIT